MLVQLNMVLNKEDAGRARITLKRLSDKARDISGGLRNVGTALLKEQNKRFLRQEDPHGKKWQKLAPLTVMLRGGKTGPILRRSGDLMNSGAYQVNGRQLRVGLNTKYAAAQHYGVTIKAHMGIPIRLGSINRSRPGFGLSKGKDKIYLKKVTVPPRPIVGFGARDEEASRNAIEDYLQVE